MDAPEEAIQVWVPPNPLARAKDISLSTFKCRLFATVEVGLPNTWQHRSAWALLSFFVKSPLSFVQSETYERVAQFYEGLQTALPRYTFGLSIQYPQEVQVKVWDYVGHYQDCPIHLLKHSYQRNGQSLQIFHQENQWLCFAKVYVNESNRWPQVDKKPDSYKTVRKFAVGRLSFEGSVASEPSYIRVTHVRPCIGLDLKGNQDLFWPWTSHAKSTDTHLMVLNLTDAKVQSFVVDLKNGLSVQTNDVFFELPQQQDSFCTGFIQVPQSPLYATIVKCRPRPGRSVIYACLFINLTTKVIESWSPKLPWIHNNEKPTSLAECNLNSFQLGTSVDNLSAFVKRIEWNDLRKVMHSENYVKLDFEQC